MKRFILLAFAVCGSQSFASSPSGLVGRWKVIKQSCLSGNPSVRVKGDAWETNIDDIELLFEEDTVQTFVLTTRKFDSSWGALAVKNEEAAVQQMPPRKRSTGEHLQKLEVLRQYVTGVHCVASQEQPYLASESTIHFGSLRTHGTDCPEEYDFISMLSASASIVEKTTGKLKLIELMPEGDRGACQPGDRFVVEMTRVQ